MKGNNQSVLADSGFWIALYNPEEEPVSNEKASEAMKLLDDALICIPWPSMYEFLNTKFARNRDRLDQFKRVLVRPNTIRINDTTYKDKALSNLLDYGSQGYNDISLVDEVIKLMLLDKDLKIKYFVSFDQALSNYAMAQGVNASLLD